MRRWLPYADPKRPDVWTDISQAIATQWGTYRNAPAFTAGNGSFTAPGTLIGAARLTVNSSGVVVLMGTTTKLYATAVAGSTFNDRSGTTYSNTATRWHFVQFGKYTLAANRIDATQVRDATTTNNYADLGGSPPKAEILVVQSNIVLAFNINDGTDYPDGWAASDVGDHTNWSTGEAVTATQILHTPGPITAAVAFKDEVLVFKKRGVYRMRYVGSPVYWTVELLSSEYGASAQGSVVVCGNIAVVADEDNGAYFFDGASFRRIDQDGMERAIHAGPRNSVYYSRSRSIWWQDSGDDVIQYNLDSGAWGKFTPKRNTGDLTGFAVQTDSELEPVIVNVATGINPGFSEEQGASTLNDLIDGYLTTSYVGAPGEMTLVDRVTPVFRIPEGARVTNAPVYTTLTMTPYSADGPEGSATAGTDVSASVNEKRFDLTKSARWQKFKIAIANSPFEIEDVIIRAKPAGKD